MTPQPTAPASYLAVVTLLSPVTAPANGDWSSLINSAGSRPHIGALAPEKEAGPTIPEGYEIVMELKNYFRKLDAWLKDNRISSARLAAEAGIAATQLSRYMRGNVDARVSTIEKLEAAKAKLERETRTR